MQSDSALAAAQDAGSPPAAHIISADQKQQPPLLPAQQALDSTATLEAGRADQEAMAVDQAEVLSWQATSQQFPAQDDAFTGPSAAPSAAKPDAPATAPGSSLKCTASTSQQLPAEVQELLWQQRMLTEQLQQWTAEIQALSREVAVLKGQTAARANESAELSSQIQAAAQHSRQVQSACNGNLQEMQEANATSFQQFRTKNEQQLASLEAQVQELLSRQAQTSRQQTQAAEKATQTEAAPAHAGIVVQAPTGAPKHAIAHAAPLLQAPDEHTLQEDTVHACPQQQAAAPVPESASLKSPAGATPDLHPRQQEAAEPSEQLQAMAQLAATPQEVHDRVSMAEQMTAGQAKAQVDEPKAANDAAKMVDAVAAPQPEVHAMSVLMRILRLLCISVARADWQQNTLHRSIQQTSGQLLIWHCTSHLRVSIQRAPLSPLPCCLNHRTL